MLFLDTLLRLNSWIAIISFLVTFLLVAGMIVNGTNNLEGIKEVLKDRFIRSVFLTTGISWCILFFGGFAFNKLAQAEVTTKLERFDSSKDLLLVDGRQVKQPLPIIKELKDFERIPDNHPTSLDEKQLKVRIGSEVIELVLSRDSKDSAVYWTDYPKYKNFGGKIRAENIGNAFNWK